jgi:hypothetical protein
MDAPSKYKRRTLDEVAAEMYPLLRRQLAEQLTADELAWFAESGGFSSGSVGRDGLWERVVGFTPDDRGYYEFVVAQLAPHCGAPSPRVWCRALGCRDRLQPAVVAVVWHPERGQAELGAAPDHGGV